MNLKQFAAAAILLLPVAATSLLAKPAAAESYRRSNEVDRSVVVRPVSYGSHHNYGHRRHYRVWVPGHWHYKGYGHRVWVPGHYSYRRY